MTRLLVLNLVFVSLLAGSTIEFRTTFITATVSAESSTADLVTDTLLSSFYVVPNIFPSSPSVPQQISAYFFASCPSFDLRQSARADAGIRIGNSSSTMAANCPVISEANVFTVPVTWGVPVYISLNMSAAARSVRSMETVTLFAGDVSTTGGTLTVIPEPCFQPLLALLTLLAMWRCARTAVQRRP